MIMKGVVDFVGISSTGKFQKNIMKKNTANRDKLKNMTKVKKIQKICSIASEVIAEINLPDLFSRTAEMAFYLTISIFPSIIFIICALAYIPEVNLINFQNSLSQVMPQEAFIIVKSVISSAVKHRSIHLLFFSFLLATWTFSKAVKSMIKGQNMAFNFKENRSFLILNGMCMVYAIGFFISIIFSIVFLIYGDNISILIINNLGNFIVLNIFYNIFRYLVPISAMVIVFVSLFTLGPCKPVHFKKCIPGAILTTILWLFFSLIYSFYVTYFFRTKEIYGSISSIIILLTWLYLCGMSITIGYKLNAILYNHDIEVTKLKSRVK